MRGDRHFKPNDESEHEKLNHGHDVPDYCISIIADGKE